MRWLLHSKSSLFNKCNTILWRTTTFWPGLVLLLGGMKGSPCVVFWDNKAKSPDWTGLKYLGAEITNLLADNNQEFWKCVHPDKLWTHLHIVAKGILSPGRRCNAICNFIYKNKSCDDGLKHAGWETEDIEPHLSWWPLKLSDLLPGSTVWTDKNGSHLGLLDHGRCVGTRVHETQLREWQIWILCSDGC